MATRTPTIARVLSYGDEAHVLFWDGLLNGDIGSPIEMPGSSDRSIQFTGTFGVGGTIVLQGSNMATPVESTDADWFTLTDPQGNVISKTAAGGEAVTELTRWVRPKVTAGDGTTDLEARLLVKRNR